MSDLWMSNIADWGILGFWDFGISSNSNPKTILNTALLQI